LATLASLLHAPLPAGAAEDSLDVSASWFGTANASANGAAGSGGPPRESVVYQGFLSSGSSYAVRKGPWKFIERENPPPFPPRNKQQEQQLAGFRARGPKHDQLFNLADDPAETRDVATAHPEIVQELRKLLAEARERGATRPGAIDK
jgi:arylsulfatase A-like enzyme